MGHEKRLLGQKRGQRKASRDVSSERERMEKLMPKPEESGEVDQTGKGRSGAAPRKNRAA